MKLIAAHALWVSALLLLAPLPGWSTSAIDEALAEAAAMGRDAAPGAAALPDVAAPPASAGTSYAETLAEPDSLEAALRPLPAPAADLPSALAESGDTGEHLLDVAPALGGVPAPPAELLPAGLRSELGLPAPMDVAPR